MDKNIPVGVVGDVDFSRLTGSFRAAGEIDGVAEKAVARHTMSDNSRNDLAAVYADGDSLENQSDGLRRAAPRLMHL